ncbi:hypothetical protein [Parasphingorhabdus sp.]|uniref:hypothetical protein n=1 Tax=Parasphingorhabdus sp. TaxID=2709688 RepID=UPI002F955145
MSEPKPLASLSSALLARKGGAKPAMRRQGIAFPTYSDHANEDLGWNDMGYDTNPDHEAAQSDEYSPEESGQYHYNPLAGAIPEVVPAVRKQQEEIAAKLSLQTQHDSETMAEPEQQTIAPRKKVPVVKVKAKQPSTPRRSAQKSRTGKAKVAFTLRLDADRHLKLRLATAVKNVSAQQLVTKAVDNYLRSIPELDDLAERITPR